MEERLAWISVISSVLLLVGYELRLLRTASHDPAATARSAHRVLRGEWVQALSRQAGSELLAVQALRNSLMSATINASTAVLVLMGSISLLVSNRDANSLITQALSLRVLLEFALVSILFATYICAAMSMRFYNHAGFAMSLPVGSPERGRREAMAAVYVQRAGTLYSWSLRCFLFTVPLAMGLLNPLLMPLAAIAVVSVLALIDRAPTSPGG